MKRFLPVLLLIAFGFLTLITSAEAAKPRVAVLPFVNTDGKMNQNIICYQFQDNLQKALQDLDPKGEHFELVPADTIEAVLAQLNIDPSNAQYLSDLWKAVKMLNVQSVLSGSFTFQSDKIVVNGYIYNARTKMPNRQHQAVDIFKDKDKPMTAVPDIIDALKPLLIPEP